MYSPVLTSNPTARVREVIVFSLPLMLVLVAASLVSFCTRTFIARYSLNALEGCVSALYLNMLFQAPFIRVASLTQVFVGRHKGAGEPYKIGADVWQMIWFSLGTILITVPASFYIGPSYFAGTSIEESGLSFFKWMVGFNFLFPLGTVLSSFYIGRKRTKMVFALSLATQIFHLALAMLLIFGWGETLPSIGVAGAPIATGISQALFCLILLCCFLRKENREKYGTGQWKLKIKTFWSCLQIAIPSTAARISVLSCWALIVHLISLQGEPYLSILSIGGSVALLFIFINEGLGQALMAIAANMLGAKQWNAFRELIRSTLIYLCLVSIILAIPLVLFPEQFVKMFFGSVLHEVSPQMIRKCCFWIWLYLFGNGLGCAGFGLLTAACDTFFYMLMTSFTWISSFLVMLCGIYYLRWPADTLWLIMAIDAWLYGIVGFLRLRKERWKNPSLFQIE